MRERFYDADSAVGAAAHGLDDASEAFIVEVGEDALDFRCFDPQRRPCDDAPPEAPQLSAAVPVPLEGMGLSAAVRDLLFQRRLEDEKNSNASEARGCCVAGHTSSTPSGGGGLAAAREPWRLPSDCDTEKMRLFCSSVLLLQEKQQERGVCHGLETKTYINLQSYDLSKFLERRRHNPGPLQLIYMFYSRIYEKLVGKQHGVEVNLFAPIDLEARNLGFRAVLDFVSDFRLFPGKVGRRELERMYCTVHPGPMSAQERFASKITFAEFVRLLAMIDGGGEPMDRSRYDGSKIRGKESRLERAKRLAQFLSLPNCKKVKTLLHDAYRDVHFTRLNEGVDFDKEARVAEMKSRPQWNVTPLPPLKPADQAKENTVCKYFVDKFTWVRTDQLWEEFEGPFLDMGTLVSGGRSSHFRLRFTNRGLALARLQLEVASGGPLRLPWRDMPLGPGQSLDAPVEFVPLECGEWCGEVIVTASWTGAFSQPDETIHIPTYMRVLLPHMDTGNLPQLPPLVSRPFRPGSSCRLLLDPTALHNRHLQTPTPGGSLCGSVVPSVAPTPCSVATPLGVLVAQGESGRRPSFGMQPPRLSSRASSSRPGSGGVRGVQLAMELQRQRSRGDASLRSGSAGPSRPHSAPFGGSDRIPAIAAATAAVAAVAATRGRPPMAPQAASRADSARSGNSACCSGSAGPLDHRGFVRGASAPPAR